MYLVWIILNERNRKTFDNSEKTDQTIKQFFMYNFLKWVRMYKGGCFLFMMDFIDWLSFKEDKGVVFCASFCFGWPFGVVVYTMYAFVHLFVRHCYHV